MGVGVVVGLAGVFWSVLMGGELIKSKFKGFYWSSRYVRVILHCID